MYGTSSVNQRLNTSFFSLPTLRGPSIGFWAGGVFDGVWPIEIEANTANAAKTKIDVRLIIKFLTRRKQDAAVQIVVFFVLSIDERTKRKVGRTLKNASFQPFFRNCEPELLNDRKLALEVIAVENLSAYAVFDNDLDLIITERHRRRRK